jgi:hypothetical protein
VTHTKPTFWALLPSRARKCSHGPFANWSRQGRSVHGHRGDDLLLQDVCYLDPYGLRDGVLRVQERRIHLPPGACGSSHQLPHGPPTHEAAHHAVKRARQNVGNLRSPEMGKSFPPPQKRSAPRRCAILGSEFVPSSAQDRADQDARIEQQRRRGQEYVRATANRERRHGLPTSPQRWCPV